MKHFSPISSEAWCYCFSFIYSVFYSGCWSIEGLQVSILLPTPYHSLLHNGISAFIIHPARSIEDTIIKILLPEIVSIETKRQKMWLWMLGSVFPNTGLPSPQEAFSSGQKIPESFIFYFYFCLPVFICEQLLPFTKVYQASFLLALVTVKFCFLGFVQAWKVKSLKVFLRSGKCQN